jgi:predicted PurR-regulated permease PerM
VLRWRGMNITRPIVFWLALLASLVAIVVMLHQVLLPFVAGMVLAYLLAPLANRIERLGMNRLLATLAIIVVVVAALATVLILTTPVIAREIEYFVENLALYIRQLHTMATNPDRPWLSKLVGEGLEHAERSIGQFTTSASGWFDTFLRSLWSGGRALISVFSLAVVTPIVACYLIYDWNRMMAAIDNWIPP